MLAGTTVCSSRAAMPSVSPQRSSTGQVVALVIRPRPVAAQHCLLVASDVHLTVSDLKASSFFDIVSSSPRRPHVD
jgi:hypothetical protein